MPKIFCSMTLAMILTLQKVGNGKKGRFDSLSIKMKYNVKSD